MRHCGHWCCQDIGVIIKNRTQAILSLPSLQTCSHITSTRECQLTIGCTHCIEREFNSIANLIVILIANLMAALVVNLIGNLMINLMVNLIFNLVFPLMVNLMVNLIFNLVVTLMVNATVH